MRGTRSLVVVLAVILAGFFLYRLLSNDPGSDQSEAGATQAVTSTDYADLVTLFGEFRSFQQGGSGNIQSYSQSGWFLSDLDTTPDFSAAAMAEKYGELRTFQERLEAIDPTGWPIPQQVDYQLVRAEMNG